MKPNEYGICGECDAITECTDTPLCISKPADIVRELQLKIIQIIDEHSLKSNYYNANYYRLINQLKKLVNIEV